MNALLMRGWLPSLPTDVRGIRTYGRARVNNARTRPPLCGSEFLAAQELADSAVTDELPAPEDWPAQRADYALLP
jgi:hypothetical protein